MENKEQDGFDSGRGSSSNPILLPEVIVYGKRPLPWYKRALNGVAKFVNDEIFLNRNNIRVKNAQRHPRAMNAVQEGGNIAGAIVAAPFAAYTAVLAAPVVMPALKVAGQAVTPSTWIGGVALATGYLAPAWLLNGADLAASAYYANEAGKDIDKNGLTWKTGLNALMSLAPMTRETEAIEGVANTLRRPAQAVSSVVDDFRAARNAVSSPETVLAREFGRSVKGTQFINVPVEHVSPNGVTKGSALDVGEEGIHLSPAGSSTTTNIQQTTSYPFVRTGTWTFSNNTRPVEVLDVGYFGRGFNPDFDAKVDKGVTNFKYTNRFEGNGNTSYLTTEPSFGLLLSKNKLSISEPDWIGGMSRRTPEGELLPDGTIIPLNHARYKTQYRNLDRYFREVDFEGPVKIDGNEVPITVFSHNGRDYKIITSADKRKTIVYTPEGREVFVASPDIMDNPKVRWKDKYKELDRIKNEAEKYILNSRNNWINSLDSDQLLIARRSLIATPLERGDNLKKADASGTIVGNMIEQSAKNDITDVYLSNEYINRFIKSLDKNPKSIFNRIPVKNRIKVDLTTLHDLSTPIFYNTDYINLGFSNSGSNTYGINGNGSRLLGEDWTSTVFHEFGHNLYSSNTPTGKYIAGYTRDLLNKYPLEYTDPRYANPGLAPRFVTYVSDPDEFRQRIMEGVRYGIKEGLTPEEIYNECNVSGFANLKPYFKKEYIIKMLGLMLGTTPLIVNSKKDDKSS